MFLVMSLCSKCLLCLTLHNLQARAVPWVGGLLVLDVPAEPLADALRNGRAVNLGGRHDAPCTGKVSDRARNRRSIKTLAGTGC